MLGGDTSSDDDYMSDKFLDPPCKPSCSGLVSKSSKERIERERVHMRQDAPKAKQMTVKREEGLKKRLGEENIGYRMLMKMGFKGDGGLGKKANGRSEPIPLEVIDGRRGLGLHNIEKKRAEAIASARRHREECILSVQSNFRASMATRFRIERAQRQLTAARHICKRFDTLKSLEQPIDEAFWPPDETRAKLLAQSGLIRREVCRSNSRRGFSNKRRKRANSSDSDHDRRKDNSDVDELDAYRGEYDTVIGVESDEDEFCDIDAAQHGPIESQPDVILSRLTVYLRDKYFYCFWCGAEFSNSSDLQLNCPGPTENDHDF